MSGYQTLSGTMSMNSKIGVSAEKFKMMKLFNATVTDYLHTKSDINSSEINKHLAHIVSDMELSIFDPHNAVTAEFYVNLFELMNSFDSSSGGLVWCTVAVLERACRNPVARLSLIHTYRFIPILSKLLLNVVGTDKKIRVLTLMQDLTYGIKISWQEPHLAILMNQLLEWVRSGNDQLATLSLSVMVNLCYKNLPSTYILTRLVDTKVFIKSLVKLQNNNNSMQVHLWKMVIILENMTGETSKADLLRFVQVTFTNVEESFKNRDMALLRHIVDFFIDMRGQVNTQKTLAEYPSFANDVNNLLISIENNSTPMETDGDAGDCSSTDPTCMAMLFEFVHSLLLLGLPELQPLHPRLVALALKWVQPEPASSQALGLLRTIAQQCTAEDSMSPLILEQLSQGFTFLVLSLEGQSLLTDTPEHVTSMIQLLLAMSKRTSLVDKVLANVKESWVNLVFSTLTETDEDRPNIDSSSPQYTNMYVHCLSLVAQLASLNHQQWALYLIELLRKPPIQSVIARALYTGSSSLREQVMKLIQMRECEFPIPEVCKILCDLEPIVMANGSSDHCQNLSDINLGMPIMSVVQQGRLDKLISKLEEAAARNQLSNPVTSEVMELYEYKLAAMSHAERSAQGSLESASNQITSLNHRLALMSNELERLHGMLYTIQLSHEKLVNEKKTSTMRLAEIEVNLKESHGHYQSEKEKRIRTVNDLKLRLDNTEIRLNSCLSELELVSANHRQVSDEKKKLEQHNKELTTMLEKYEEKYKSYKLKVEEGEKVLVQTRKVNNELTKELESLQQIRNEQEQKLNEKENFIMKLKDDLKELEQMRDLIVTISTKKRMTS